MAEKKEFEPLLTEEETLEIRDNFVGFYENLDTIQDYFLARKKEKIVDIKHEKYTVNMFNDPTVEPKDMNFRLRVIEGKMFTPSTQIIT